MMGDWLITMDDHEVTLDDAPEVTRKKGGIEKVVQRRTIECYCRLCDRIFRSTGPAWSHARSARHRVEVSYSVDFDFVPVEVNR